MKHTNAELSREALKTRPQADVLVIGGGINGVAILRDLALQGIDAALIDASDFTSGTTIASSRMIHGGIRYLENGEFRLVKEALAERNSLLRQAPHLISPLQTTVPIFSTFSGLLAAPMRFFRHSSHKPQERGAVLIKLGLVIYDLLARSTSNLDRHRFFGARKTKKIFPELSPDVSYTATYWDASIHSPERLIMDLLHDSKKYGKQIRAANYVQLIGTRDNAVVLNDSISGEEFTFKANVIVNATGPWVDLTNRALGTETHVMGGTKGSHLVLDHPELFNAVQGREFFFEHSDGRIVLIHPLHGRVLVGATDLEHNADSPAVCTASEVQYFIDLIAQVFPDVEVLPKHIVFKFSGVRPLPAHGDLSPGFVSRDYRVTQTKLPHSESLVLSLIGGKLTTFQASAQTLVDIVLRRLGRSRAATANHRPIGGGANYPSTAHQQKIWLDEHCSAIPALRATELFKKYGTRAAEFAEAITLAQNDRPLESLPTFSTEEIRHLARTEAVEHLSDLVFRRTSIGFRGEALKACTELATILQEELDWDDSRTLAEVTALRNVSSAQSNYAPLLQQSRPLTSNAGPSA